MKFDIGSRYSSSNVSRSFLIVSNLSLRSFPCGSSIPTAHAANSRFSSLPQYGGIECTALEGKNILSITAYYAVTQGFLFGKKESK